MKVITSYFYCAIFPCIEDFERLILYSLRQVYLCEKLSLTNEMYFAITLDRKTAGPVCHLSQILLYFAVHFIISIRPCLVAKGSKGIKSLSIQF
jgi:hypothetical protein